MLDGVPLRLRSILVRLDRPSFTLNPTNCSPLAINATLTSTDGATANPSNRFQASACDKLGFKPDLKLSLKGGTARSDHPALKARPQLPQRQLRQHRQGGRQLAAFGVPRPEPHQDDLHPGPVRRRRLPQRLDLRLRHRDHAAARPAARAARSTCAPPATRSRTSSPALHGQIDVDLVGRIDSKNGGIRTTFDAVPDAPVTKFVLTMQGGKKGLLENSKNLCASTNKADVKFTAQNGKTSNSTPVLTQQL